MKTTTKLRRLLEKKGIIIAPGAPDPLTAKIVQDMGFEVAYLGGYMTGAKLCTTEPLLTLTEMVMTASYITAVVDIPLIVDGDAGFGDATHTSRMVREFERVGVAAVHIEDQVFPKRVSYHRGLKHIIPMEEMLKKIDAAIKAREDPDFIIIARTDAIGSMEGDEEEAIRRANAYAKAGADVIMPSGWTLNDIEQVKRIVQSIHAPVMLISPDGMSHAGCPTPKITVKEFEEAGVKILIYPLVPMLVSINAIIKAYKKIKAQGWMGLNQNMLDTTREIIERVIRIQEYVEMEKKTTELKSI